MRTLGEDIILLALKPDGRLRMWDRLRFAVAGSELVRLAASGRVEIVDGRITAGEAGPSELADPLLAAALADIRGSKQQPPAGAWVAGRPQRVVDAYLAALDAAGIVRTERRRMLGLTLATRWYVVDAPRQEQARARLDQIALADRAQTGAGTGGEPWNETAVMSDGGGDGGGEAGAQAALCGLVTAIGLDRELYPGPESEPARARLAAAGRRNGLFDLAAQAAGNAVLRAAQEAIEVALHAAVEASTDAATGAVLHAGHHGSSFGGHH